MSLEVFDGKQTSWAGLWWHPEYNGFSSEAINLSQLKKFKGNVRLYVRKNKFFNNGENKRPNYNFCIKASDSAVFREMNIEDCDNETDSPYMEDGVYYEGNGDRLYTREEVRKIINGTVSDVEYGIHDPYDILPEDFV